MSAKLEQLSQKLAEILGARITNSVLRLGELTIEVDRKSTRLNSSH